MMKMLGKGPKGLRGARQMLSELPEMGGLPDIGGPGLS
jgi:hypothetical protein